MTTACICGTQYTQYTVIVSSNIFGYPRATVSDFLGFYPRDPFYLHINFFPKKLEKMISGIDVNHFLDGKYLA